METKANYLMIGGFVCAGSGVWLLVRRLRRMTAG